MADYFYIPLPATDPRGPAYYRQRIPSSDDRQAVAERIGALLAPPEGCRLYDADGSLLREAVVPVVDDEPVLCEVQSEAAEAPLPVKRGPGRPPKPKEGITP
jgi:hypothetical protein